MSKRCMGTPRPRRPVKAPTLGIDIGGVIVTRGTGADDSSFFGTRPMDTPPVPGAVEAISALATTSRFAGHVHLVSKAGPKIADISQQWLVHAGFLTATGLTLNEVHFVRERADKAAVCARLRVTHFVDDQLSVLNRLPDVPFRYLFTGSESTDEDLAYEPPPGIVRVADWPTLHAALAEDYAS